MGNCAAAEFSGTHPRGRKLEIKTIRSGCAAKLAKVIKSEECGAGLHDVKPFCFVQAHSWCLYCTNLRGSKGFSSIDVNSLIQQSQY